jgi:hypothetical protein
MKVVINPAAASAAEQLRSEADANSTVENENQAHDLSADKTPGHIQPAELAHIGERPAREVLEKSSINHGGRHITQQQRPDGQRQQANIDREASVLANREESAKSFESKRRSVAPNHKRK